MNKLILLGNEALGLGAIHAGVSCCFGYPGTPSTEIISFCKSRSAEGGFSAQWCTNEKTAFESALGVSFCGKRALVAMKQVGLNAAADPFMNSTLCAIKGGLVLAVADDPSMHSSQNEQDSRYYAEFAMTALLEPANQQEAYEMTISAFSVSEKYKIPVIVRLVTRVAHSRSAVSVHARLRRQNNFQKAKSKGWLLLPSISRINYNAHIGKQSALSDWSEKNSYNTLRINTKRKDFAVITSGIGRNYYAENISDYMKAFGKKGLPSHLHIGSMPFPGKKINLLTKAAREILVIEEGMPLIEKQCTSLIGSAYRITGKLSGVLPRTGELNPDHVRTALGLTIQKSAADTVKVSSIPQRPPQLCKGCPHSDSFSALNKALLKLNRGILHGADTVVCADIGCYSLCASAPFFSMETIVCMGASIPMAKGAAEAGCRYSFGVIGDSTFLHSGITGLIDAAVSQVNMNVIILDNGYVAMTGCQPTMLSSNRFMQIALSVGCEPTHTFVLETKPSAIDINAKIIEKEARYNGLSVIILSRPCPIGQRQDAVNKPADRRSDKRAHQRQEAAKK